MLDLQKRTWAQIHLDAIAHNYRVIRSHLQPGTKFLGVVKADAYGHGAFQVAALLEKLGCDYLSTATVDEAIALREAGIRAPILLFGYTDPRYTKLLLRYDLTQSVGSAEQAQAYASCAAAQGQTLRVHLKVDSGMGRLGFKSDGEDFPVSEMARTMSLPGLEVEGIFTHFATSELQQDTYTETQLADFLSVVCRVEEIAGRKFAIKHCANSGAVINYKESHLDMVRPGILLYGLYPGEPDPAFPVRPAMELKTRVVQIKSLSPGESVSYGRTFTADEPRTIAVLSIGYADGLFRPLSNRMDMLLHGRRVPQVGNICMDLCMIDVTGLSNVQVGDVVTVFGQDGDQLLSSAEQAARCGTISYEMVCAVSPRVPRVYDGSCT